MLQSKQLTRNTLFSVFILSLIALIHACANTTATETAATTDTNMQALKGEVFYREKVMPPKGATLNVLLVEVPEQDVAGEVITSTVEHLYKAPPYAFEIEYDANVIKPKHSYAIQARIEVSSKLRMTTTERIDPFAEGVDSSNIQVMVKNISLSPARQAAKDPMPESEPAALIMINSLTKTQQKMQGRQFSH